MHKISVIIPTYNEWSAIKEVLQSLWTREKIYEVILCDQSHQKEVEELAWEFWVTYIRWTWSNRAETMNEWASYASWDRYCFLHADSTLPQEAFTRLTNQDPRWFIAFPKRFTTHHRLLTPLTRVKNYRMKRLWLIQWDNAITISRKSFQVVGWYPSMALFEDVKINSLRKKAGLPLKYWPLYTTTSSRKFIEWWVIKTIFFMIWMVVLYKVWISSQKLQKLYYK